MSPTAAAHNAPAPRRTGGPSGRAPSRRRRRPTGFTLIEVLATLVLMAIVLPVAMHGVSLALRAASVSRNTSVAAALAQSKLAQLVTEMNTTGTANSSGDFNPDHPEFTWVCTSTARDYGMTQLDLRVLWQERDGERSVNLSTLYVPPGSTTTGTDAAGTTGTATGGG